MPTFRERLADLLLGDERRKLQAQREFITGKFMGTDNHRYCTRCGEKLVYRKRNVFYNRFTGEIAHVVHTFTCPMYSEGLFGDYRHDVINFEYRGAMEGDYADV